LNDDCRCVDRDTLQVLPWQSDYVYTYTPACVRKANPGSECRVIYNGSRTDPE
jgi:hypothetical protein